MVVQDIPFASANWIRFDGFALSRWRGTPCHCSHYYHMRCAAEHYKARWCVIDTGRTHTTRWVPAIQPIWSGPADKVLAGACFFAPAPEY